MAEPIHITFELTDEEAWHLAELLSRFGVSELRAVARDDDDARATL